MLACIVLRLADGKIANRLSSAAPRRLYSCLGPPMNRIARASREADRQSSLRTRGRVEYGEASVAFGEWLDKWRVIRIVCSPRRLGWRPRHKPITVIESQPSDWSRRYSFGARLLVLPARTIGELAGRLVANWPLAQYAFGRQFQLQANMSDCCAKSAQPGWLAGWPTQTSIRLINSI